MVYMAAAFGFNQKPGEIVIIFLLRFIVGIRISHGTKLYYALHSNSSEWAMLLCGLANELLGS